MDALRMGPFPETDWACLELFFVGLFFREFWGHYQEHYSQL